MPPAPPAVESLLAFWADAGVEAAYSDAPVDRTAEGARLLRKAPAASRPASVVAAHAASSFPVKKKKNTHPPHMIYYKNAVAR
jgi:hypothetical protein